MIGFKRILVLTLVCVFGVDRGICSQEEMDKMMQALAKVLDECKKEENVGDHILQDLDNFWREDYQLLNRELGCMMLCMATKLDLVDENLRMHHENAQEFAKAHGADDKLAMQLVKMVHDCEDEHEAIEDKCVRVLETAKCFRTKIRGLNWAPSIEDSKVVIEEVVAAM